MTDRSETKPLTVWTNPYLQTLANSAPAQSHLRLATWTNPTTQLTDEGQRQVQRMATHDISSRTINLPQSRHRNRRHLLTSTSAHSTTRNYENSQVHGGSVQIHVERPARVTSAYRTTLKTNQNLSESDQQDARVENITMSYTSAKTVTAEKSSREEITVMQRYSTGETSLVYQGYLTKGETFSFKSQRRSTSRLSLAFYVDGSIESVTSECCEFKCIQTNTNAQDQKQFLFKDIQKANPCEKCRKEYADKLLLNNDKNTLLVRRSKKFSENHETNKHQQQTKASKYKKSKSAEVPDAHQNLQTTTTVNPSLFESATTQPAGEQKSTEKAEDNPSNSNETGTITINGEEMDLNKLMQMLATRVKQNVSIQSSQSSRMKRHPKSVENFCYILENHLPISKDEQQTLRGLINLGFTFDDINSKESIEFLKKIVNERVILILSKSSMENLSKPIRDEPLLSAIYVIDPSEKHSFDSKFYRGSFPNITKLCTQLKNDLQILTYDLTSISSIPGDFAGMSTLNYAQALKDILLESDEKRDLKKEMIDFCREEYADNVIQLKLIDEFENNFQPNDAIRWYLRYEAFLNKMITRAFRVLDPDILFKLRYFIQHLHSQLKSSVNTSPLTVYRTLRIRKDLFDKMKKNQGALLSFNEFILVNKNQSAAEPSLINIDSKVVHFEIVLEAGISRCGVEIQPKEVLLTVGTIFRIDKVEPIDEETFTVKLKTNDDILKAGELLTKDLRDAVRAPFPLVRMAKLMKQRELMGYTEYFCSMLIDDQQALEDKTTNLTLGGLLHSLGTFYYERKLYEQALNHLQNSLKVYLRVLPENDVRLTPTYNNIGSIYHKQDLYEKSLEYHQKAYEIQKNAKDPDMDSVAAYIGNIGPVLIKLRRYKEAINYFELDLQIKQKLHPKNDHPDVAARYHNLAGAQYRLQQYSEALENYQKCLDIELKCHTAKNPTVSVTYYNLATTLEELGRLQEAKEAVEKAIARLVLTKREDDEDLQMQRRYLQRLEEKLFMKDLFTAT